MIKDYYIYEGTTLLGLLYIPVGLPNDKIIPSFITTIGEKCFKNQTFSTIIIPPSVKVINNNAFEDCKYLIELTIPQTVQQVGDEVCLNCTALETFSFYSSTQMGDRILKNCANLKNMTIDQNIFHIWYHQTEHTFGIGMLHSIIDDNYCVYKGQWSLEDLLGKYIPINEVEQFYFVEKNNKVWYDSDLQQALQGCKYLNSGLSASDFFHSNFTSNELISWSEFSILLGICQYGRKIWDKVCQTEEVGSSGYITIQDLLTILNKHGIFKPILIRFLEVLQHKNDVFYQFTDISNNNVNLSQYYKL